jgi:FAD/FMN-containing dehydrogenase
MALDSTTRLNDAAVAGLRGALRGQLLEPHDAGYDDARRVWNGAIDRRPRLIARCAAPADVSAVIGVARRHGLPLAVRGGGHSFAGQSVCDDGVVIDLSPMKGIHVDPERRTAEAQAGVLWSELDRATQACGLAVTGGVISHTGIAGLTLGGGIGWLMRKYGLTVDSLLSVDLVTAEGTLVSASAQEHPDLFWAVRGGGGNFGVVTSFRYRLHPVGPLVMAGIMLYPVANAGAILRCFRDIMPTAPDEVGAQVVFVTAPPAPFIPPPLHGTRMIGIAACHCGTVEDAARDLAPLRRVGPPAVDLVQPMPYAALQQMNDASAPHGRHYYAKAHQFTELSDDAIDVLVEHAATSPSPSGRLGLVALGGAVSRVPEAATAVGHRDAAFTLEAVTDWTDREDAERHVRWTRDLWTALRPFAARGIYVNFLHGDESAGARAAYSPDAWERLVAVKGRYDPTNLFRLNQNIPPAGWAPAD